MSRGPGRLQREIIKGLRGQTLWPWDGTTWASAVARDIFWRPDDDGPTRYELESVRRALAALERDGVLTSELIEGETGRGRQLQVRLYWLARAVGRDPHLHELRPSTKAGYRVWCEICCRQWRRGPRANYRTNDG